MRAVVRPDVPIVVGLAFEVLPILVVQKGNYLVQHGCGNRHPGAKHRPRKLQGKISADAFGRNKILEIWVSPDTGGSVKFDPLVDALGDGIAHRGVEFDLGQRLAGFEIALIEEVVVRGRHPIDVLEPAADANSCTVLGVVRIRSGAAASSQLRKRGLLVLAGSLDIHDGVTREAALALHLGAKLARRAEFDIIREEPIIGRVGSPLDDQTVRLQHEPRNYAVLAAATKWERHPGDDKADDNKDRAAPASPDPSCRCRRSYSHPEPIRVA